MSTIFLKKADNKLKEIYEIFVNIMKYYWKSNASREIL
jgi:hypothetical protein